MKLKDSYVERLGEIFPGLTIGSTVDGAYGAIAIHLDADRAVQTIGAGQQRNVLRRLAFHSQGEPCRAIFHSLVLMELRKKQRQTIAIEALRETREAQQSAKNEARRDRKEIEQSLHLPVSRIAAEAEHLAVLAALPDAAFARTPEWRKTRWQAIVMAGSACSVCGCGPRDGKRLVARHIVSRIVAPEKAFDLFNIRVRCAECDTGARTLRGRSDAPAPANATPRQQRLRTAAPVRAKGPAPARS